MRETVRLSGRKLLWIALGAGALILLGFILYEPELIYAMTPPEAAEALEQSQRKRVRVRGHIAKGSLRRSAAGCRYQFALEDQFAAAERTVNIICESCTPPESFEEWEGYQLNLTVSGRPRPAERVVEAEAVWTACPPRYFYEQRPLPRQLPVPIDFEQPL